MITLLLFFALAQAVVAADTNDARTVDLGASAPHRVTRTVLGTDCRDAVWVLTVRRADGRVAYTHSEPVFSLHGEPDISDADARAMGCDDASRFARISVRHGNGASVYDEITRTGYQTEGGRPAPGIRVLCHHRGYEGGVCLSPRSADDPLTPLFTYGL